MGRVGRVGEQLRAPPRATDAAALAALSVGGGSHAGRARSCWRLPNDPPVWLICCSFADDAAMFRDRGGDVGGSGT